MSSSREKMLASLQATVAKQENLLAKIDAEAKEQQAQGAQLDELKIKTDKLQADIEKLDQKLKM
jgi:hypothetical protein